MDLRPLVRDEPVLFSVRHDGVSLAFDFPFVLTVTIVFTVGIILAVNVGFVFSIDLRFVLAIGVSVGFAFLLAVNVPVFFPVGIAIGFAVNVRVAVSVDVALAVFIGIILSFSDVSMAFAGTRTRGPACGCCCMNVYVTDAVPPARLKVTSMTNWTVVLTETYTTTTTSFAFDRKNEVLYRVLRGTPSTIYKNAEAVFTAPTVVASIADDVLAIECDPTNERLFFIAHNGGDARLAKLNYDGTGETTIVSWTGWTAGGFEGRAVRYDLTLDRVYYVKEQVGAGKPQLRYVAPDGTGDTLIRGLNVTGLGNGTFRDITIDVTNRYLMWSEYDVGVGGGVKRSAMDGTGIIAVHTQPEFILSTICFSQLQEKLHVWDENNFGDDYIYRMNSDGTDVEQLAEGGGPPFFALGCGLETVGPEAIL